MFTTSILRKPKGERLPGRHGTRESGPGRPVRRYAGPTAGDFGYRSDRIGMVGFSAAADEATYKVVLCERWAIDYAQGRMPHHINDDEMPAGWTEDDLKYGPTERDE